MRFERGLKPFVFSKSFLQKEFRSDETTDEIPVLSTRLSAIGEMNYDDIFSTPELLKLRCELRPVFDERVIFGRCSFNDVIHDGCILWDLDKKPLKSIHLIFTGHGYFFNNNQWCDFVGMEWDDVVLTCEREKILYTKSFIHLEDDLSLKMHQTHKGKTFSFPGDDILQDMLCRPLWGYGGSFYPQIKISDIMQYYLTIDQIPHKQTTTMVFSKKKLWEKGIKLFQNQIIASQFLGKVALVNNEVDHHHQTLEEDLVSGLSEVFLWDKDVLKNMSNVLKKETASSYFSQRYKSVKAEQLGLSRFVEVTFQKQN